MSEEATTLLKLASHCIMRKLPIIVFCNVAMNLLLYDIIILMLFMHHNKLEYVEQMHIQSFSTKLMCHVHTVAG